MGVSAEDLRRQLSSQGRFVWIARRVDDEVAARVRALRLPGIRIVREDRRVYASGPLAGAVLGFTGTGGGCPDVIIGPPRSKESYAPQESFPPCMCGDVADCTAGPRPDGAEHRSRQHCKPKGLGTVARVQ